MRVLVIPDIHLKPWIFDRTEKILRDGKADRAVCLMDMPDDSSRSEVRLHHSTSYRSKPHTYLSLIHI